MAFPGKLGRPEPSGRDVLPDGVARIENARIENARGRSPVVLVCEHASNHIPPHLRDLGLGRTELESHIAWDPGAFGVARGLSKLLDAPLAYATVSRLVIDLNRATSAPNSIVAMSEFTPVPGNSGLAPEERARREAFYRAFHDALGALIESRAAAGLVRAVVSVHSFTPVYRGIPRPWHVGLLFHRDERLARLLQERLREDRETVVGLNEPYSPADGVFHTLERHAERRSLAPLMIEIRNDLIRERDQQSSWSNQLAPLLKEATTRL